MVAHHERFGLPSLFIPAYSIAFLRNAILRSVGALGVSIPLLVEDLAAPAVIAAWACNEADGLGYQRKPASLDATASAIVLPNPRDID
jgi:hypothetical protein